MDDLRAVRGAVSVPVLAKEFVVDPRQLDLLRAAGADLVLLLAVLHPAKRLARLVAQTRDLGMEPLVEAHDAREVGAAVASGARLIGIEMAKACLEAFLSADFAGDRHTGRVKKLSTMPQDA